MAQLVSGNDKFPDFGYEDDYRFYLITRRDASGDYRFARKHGKRARVHARNALRRVNGYLKNMIEAIANSKMRRIERELELRGIDFYRRNDNWATRGPDRSEDRPVFPRARQILIADLRDCARNLGFGWLIQFNNGQPRVRVHEAEQAQRKFEGGRAFFRERARQSRKPIE